MAEVRPFPWRGAFFGLAALCVAGGGVFVGAYANGVRLERAAPASPAAFGQGGGHRPGPLAALAPGDRAAVRRQLALAWQAAAPERAEAREARRRAFAVASAETYHVEAMRAALAEVRAADTAATAKLHDSLAQAMVSLNATERAALAMAVQRNRLRAPPRAEGGAPAPDGPAQRP